MLKYHGIASAREFIMMVLSKDTKKKPFFAIRAIESESRRVITWKLHFIFFQAVSARLSETYEWDNIFI